MRLWHIDLIPYLPKSQLIAQWRELNSLFKKQDRHILINYIYDYDKYYLQMYAKEVMYEMDIRGIKHNDINYMSYFHNLPVDSYRECTSKYPEHDDTYLLICFMNLYEKYLRGQTDFTQKIFFNLYDYVNNKFDLKSLGIEKEKRIGKFRFSEYPIDIVSYSDDNQWKMIDNGNTRMMELYKDNKLVFICSEKEYDEKYDLFDINNLIKMYLEK